MATPQGSIPVTRSPDVKDLLDLYHDILDIHVPSILAGVNVHHGRAHTDFGVSSVLKGMILFIETVDILMREVLRWL